MMTEFERQRQLQPRQDGTNCTKTCRGKNTIALQFVAWHMGENHIDLANIH
jgi:hypothetical protein